MRIKDGVVIIDDPKKGQKVKEKSPDNVRVRIRNGQVVLDGATGGWTEGLEGGGIEEGGGADHHLTVSTAGGSDAGAGGDQPTAGPAFAGGLVGGEFAPVGQGGGGDGASNGGAVAVNGGEVVGGTGGVEGAATTEASGDVVYEDLNIDDL